MFLTNPPDVQFKIPRDPASPLRDEMVDAGVVIIREPVKILLPDKRILTVRTGFDFDGISVPRAFWSSTYHPFSHRTMCAGLTHDALYAAELVSRELADEFFRAILEQWGVSWYQRNKMYVAVRGFGGSVWSDHTRADVEFYRSLITITEQGAAA